MNKPGIPTRIQILVCASTTNDKTLQSLSQFQDCSVGVAKINLFPFPSKSWVVKHLLRFRGSLHPRRRGRAWAGDPRELGSSGWRTWVAPEGNWQRRRREVECGESSLLPPGALWEWCEPFEQVDVAMRE